MVIPWVGYSLSNLIKGGAQRQCEIHQFVTLASPSRCPANKPVLKCATWKGRQDEAVPADPLLTVGMYGQVTANQAGRPFGL